MRSIVVDYGESMVKYSIDGKEYIGKRQRGLEEFIEWLIKKYYLVEEEVKFVLVVDIKEYVDTRKRLKVIEGGKYHLQIFPRLVGVVIENIDKLDEVCGVLEIGYDKVQYAMFRGGRVSRESVLSIDYGIEVLLKEVGKVIEEKYHLEGDRESLYSLLLNHSDTEMTRVFEVCKYQYLEGLRQEILKRNAGFDLVKNYVYGFESELLREQINLRENFEYVSNTVYDGIRGVGKVMHLV